MAVPTSSFAIYAGESLPLRLTIDADGNGEEITSIEDAELTINAEVYEVECEPDCGASALFTKSGDDVTISGKTARWTFTAAETREFPEKSRVYVNAVDSDGVSSVVHIATVVKRCR